MLTNDTLSVFVWMLPLQVTVENEGLRLIEDV